MTKDFLRKIKLIQGLSIEIPMNQLAFKNKLSRIMEDSGFDIFEGFSNNNGKLFAGRMDEYTLEIRPKRKIFNFSQAYLSKFKGQYSSTGVNQVLISGEVSAPLIYIYFTVGFLILFYSIIFFVVMLTPGRVFSSFILLHGCFMLGVFYILFRRSVNSSRHFIERELYFLTKP